MSRLPGGLVLPLIALFLVVRGAHLAWSWSAPLGGDALDYDRLAWMTVQGEPWVNWRPEWDYQFGPAGTPTAVRSPGFPLFVALIYGAFGHHVVVARMALVLLNALAAGMLFDAMRRAWGVRPAAIVTVAWTFWPVSVRALYYVDSLLAESLAIPLIILTLWLLVREGMWSALLAGLALGAAILTRPHLALTAPVAAAIAVVALWRSRAARNRIFACALVSCLCLVPWAARNYAVFGKVIPLSSQAGIGLWIGWAADTTGSWDNTAHELSLVQKLVDERPEMRTTDEPGKSDIYKEKAIEELKRRGLFGTITQGLWKAWLHLRPWETFYGFHSMLLVATVLAVLARRALWSSPAAVVASAVWISLFLSSVLTYYLGRYRFLGTPALLFLAAAGLAPLLEMIEQALARRAVALSSRAQGQGL